MQVPSVLPTATFRLSPDDFVVDELPAYPPSGQGEHTYVTFRKVGLTTPEAVKRIAHALGADIRGVGFAGMKDRHAVTTQTASFPVPIAKDPAPVLAEPIEGITILAVSRHGNKLKPGHLLGNRFRIVLRDVDPAAAPGMIAALDAIGKAGVPNAFGPQRFGRDGDNPARALEWLSGKTRGPRDKREQRMLFSALQSLWFNQLLARRESEGTWSEILPGDLAKKTDTGGIFLVPLEGPDTDDARARGKAGELVPTGPMFGKKMRWPEGAPGAIEREILAAALGDAARLDGWGHLGEGTRRPLRMDVQELATSAPAPDASAIDPRNEGDPRAREAGVSISVSFVLPKGGYATTVLGRVARLVDASIARSNREQTADPDRLPQDDSASQEEDVENG